jgi:hypothetical protein
MNNNFRTNLESIIENEKQSAEAIQAAMKEQ